ncbi:cell division FtsA domain-containing protein [Candidatus Omnitrophota bacterium]
MLSSHICTIDVGSSKIAATLVVMRAGKIFRIYADSVISGGVKKGSVVDSGQLSKAVSQVLENLSEKSKVRIRSVYAAVSGDEIFTRRSSAVIPLTERGNKLIGAGDLRKVNRQARILGVKLEEELMHEIPLSYGIDSKRGVLNPLGLYSHRLEVQLYLVSARLASVQALEHSINQAGFELRDVYFSGMATERIIAERGPLPGINVICDLGSEVSELLITRDGVTAHIEVLPIGGQMVTSVLSHALEITPELAEDVKRSHGVVGADHKPCAKSEILVKKGGLYAPIDVSPVPGIVTVEAKRICDAIKKSIEKVTPCGKVHSVTVAGRAALLEGFLEALENTLGVTCRLARIQDAEMLAVVNKEQEFTGHKYINYLTCLGAVLLALRPEGASSCVPIQASRNPVQRAINKVKEVYEEYF